MVVLNVWVTTSVISLSIVLIIYSLHTSLLLFRTEPNGALDTTINGEITYKFQIVSV